jgi:hypothetical protein
MRTTLETSATKPFALSKFESINFALKADTVCPGGTTLVSSVVLVSVGFLAVYSFNGMEMKVLWEARVGSFVWTKMR